MASRKDFASKKRGATRSTGAKSAAKKTKKPAVDEKKTPLAIAPAGRKGSWKLIIASVFAVSTIGWLLAQLIQVDPRDIRESGISAIINQNFTAQTSDEAPLPTALKNSNPKPKIANKQPLKQPSNQLNDKDKALVSKIPVTEKSTAAKQKEPFQFYTMLAENSVETETIAAYKSTPKTANLKSKLYLQTGSFRSAKDAERMKVRLLLNNFSEVAVTKITSNNGSIWYRVRTGPYTKFNKLKTALIKLDKLKISPLQVPIKWDYTQ